MPVWTTDLLRQGAAWTDLMNGALVEATPAGLRVVVAPEATWAIAAVPRVRLPASVVAVRATVRDLTPGATWLVRVYGDVYGHGRPTTWSGFGGETTTGTVELPCDPRLFGLAADAGLQLQVGIEGPAGAAVNFEALEFVPAPPNSPAAAVAGQIGVPAVELMPNLPATYQLIDWRAKARAFDRLAFNRRAAGQYLPLCWLDNRRRDRAGLVFGLSSYVGDHRVGGRSQEAVTALGAVLGATLIGIDKRAGVDWVGLTKAWQTHTDASRLVLNTFGERTGGSFWYEIFPGLVFSALSTRHPQAADLAAIVRTGAERWADACVALGGDDVAAPNFDHTAFDFNTGQAVDNGHWREPDAAAGVAWLEHQAWLRWPEPRYLAACMQALRFLDARAANPYYECLLPWGTLTAARLNAELGQRYDVDKLLRWCFGISECRGGWGVTLGRWGDYDVAGLVGSIDNRGGYAFAMNTFTQAAALAPLPRYDPRYARAIGKWLLNLTSAARLFYPGELPPAHQSGQPWAGDSEQAIAYEGLRARWLGQSPCATGDPVAMAWGPETDLGLYGSAYVGLLAAMVEPTDQPTMPAFDLLATDFGHGPAWPTQLVYNPHADPRTVTLNLPAGRHDVYDAVQDRMLARGVRRRAPIEIAGDRAAVLVAVPAGTALLRDRGQVSAGGRVVRWTPRTD